MKISPFVPLSLQSNNPRCKSLNTSLYKTNSPSSQDSFLGPNNSQLYFSGKGSELRKAARSNDIDSLMQLISGKKVNIDDKNAMGQTALHAAAYDEKIEAMQFLLENGADTEAKGLDGNTPLYGTARMGKAKAAKELIRYRSNINYQINYGATPLSIAAQKGNTEVMQVLLENGADTELGAERGETPLWKAAKNRHAEALKLLIRYGANIHAKDKNGKTVFSLTGKKYQEVRGILDDHKRISLISEPMNKTNSTKSSLRPGGSTSQRSVAPQRPGLDASIFSRNSVSDRRSVLTERPARQAASSSSVNPSGSRISTADRATAERVFGLIDNSHFLFEPEAQGIASQLNRNVAHHLAQIFQDLGVAEDDVFQLSSDQLRASHGHPDICRFWRDFSNHYPWQDH